MDKLPPSPSPSAMLSATARAHEKTKFKRGRSDAAREIERWARIGVDLDYPKTGSVRTTGQLSSNVTEQRLLETKVLELSRARYRFKSQNQYDRSMFLERQRRKSSIFRDLFADVTTDGHRSARGGSTETLLHQDRASRHHLRATSRMSLSGRPPKPASCSNDRVLPDKSIMHRTSLSRVSAPVHGIAGSTDCDGKSDFPPEALARSQSVVEPHESRPQHLPQLGKHATPTFATERRESDGKSIPGDGTGADGRHMSIPLHPPRRRDSRGPLRDPRYRCLERSLSFNYAGQLSTLEVPMLVGLVDSLHIPSGRETSTKHKKTTFNAKLYQLVAGVPPVF